MVLNNTEIVSRINEELVKKGIKYPALAERTGIPYQLLMRRLAQNGEKDASVKLEAVYFFKIITFLNIPLTDFAKTEGAENEKENASA